MNLNTRKYIQLLNKFFDREASKDEIESLAQWMKHGQTSEEFDAYCHQQWNLSATEIDEQLSLEIWNEIESKVNPKPKRKFLQLPSRFYRIAAILLFPICMAMGAYIASGFGEELGETFQVMVDKGQKANIVLPEGTKVWINSGTKIKYTYQKDVLRVYLEGEAYFEVSKKEDRHFIVNSNDINVESLGTTFNVKGYPTDNFVTVSLLEGKVKVYDNATETLMKPKETLIFNKQDKSFVKQDIKDSREVDFWRRNILYFRSTTLAEIGTTLERMYGVTIKFEDEGLKDVPFSGSIRNSSLNNIFHIISLTYPITYTINDDTITLSKDKTIK